MKHFCTTILILFTLQFGFSQYQIGLIPRQSPDCGVYAKIGFTDVEIKYGSPQVRGRKVWGNLAPFEKVWRAGANNATTIEVSENILIEGNLLPKGKYALFIIPKEKEKWEIIFSKKSKQWGAFGYDKNEDALRVNVLPIVREHQENLEYVIDDINVESGTLVFSWEKVKIKLKIETQLIEIFRKKIEKKAKTTEENIRWIVYLQGAEFLAKKNQNLDLALEWINTSEKTSNVKGEWNRQFYPKDYILGHLYWTKAKILSQQSKYQQALNYIELLKGIKSDYNFYHKKNEVEQIDTQVKKWQALLSSNKK